MIANMRLPQGNIENIELIWNISCLFGRQTVSVSCSNLPTTNTAYLVRFRGRRKCYTWKICRGEPWNLANWLAEFGKIYHRKTVVP